MPPKKKTSGLGNAIKAAHTKKKVVKGTQFVATEIADEGFDKFKSVVDRNDMVDFLVQAEMSGRQFEAVRNAHVLNDHNDGRGVTIDLTAVKKAANPKELIPAFKKMQIPRKPKWNEQTTAEQLNQAENAAFLRWRREIAAFEENNSNIHVTPYEKNLEIWRQLWRVVERSEILVQIVDGRNPMFYRCEDLERYVKEVDPTKQNVLLINKSDLLNDQVRKVWSDYLNKLNISHLFFSARMEQEKIDKDIVEEKEHEITDVLNTPTIVNRRVLMELLKKKVTDIRQAKPEMKDEIITIGFVGYPNVGKSSLINVLSQRKLVGVTSTPGKTKHFQTIMIDKKMMLCDCPGLVFPSLVSSRAEMVCNGVLPIDHMKDYWTPIQVIAMNVPHENIEKLYNITIKFEGLRPNASAIMQSYAASRGYFLATMVPNEAKVSKILLKDYLAGKLLYCTLPPDYDPKVHGPVWQWNKKEDFDKKPGEQETIPEEEDEKKEQEKVPRVDAKRVEQADDKFFEEEGKGDAEEIDDDEIIAAVETKQLKGQKLTKQQRRELKWAAKRGEKIEVRDGELIMSKKPAKHILGI